MAAKWRGLCLVTILTLASGVAIARAAAQASPRIIEMTAKNYDFTPSSIHVKVGETVRLLVTATDREHGVKIKAVANGAPKDSPAGLEITSQPDCVKFKKDETGTVEFIARSPGTYEFECCKVCGMGHGKMKGEIIVEP